MSDIVWILPEVVRTVHTLLLAEHGGAIGVRDPKLLDSALARPRQKSAYASDPSIPELAAAYSYGIARNHPFVDGNKRVALTLAAMFLELNGYTLIAPETDTALVYEQLAADQLSEEQLTQWLQEFSIKQSE